jgi:hypothetical protein
MNQSGPPFTGKDLKGTFQVADVGFLRHFDKKKFI